MCFRHADRGTYGTWSTRTWSSCACGACFRRRWQTRRQNIHARLCEKKPGANLPGVVHHKLWRGQLRGPVPHTPVHGGRSPRVVVVAQEVDGLAVLPGDGTQSSPAPEFVPATFGQPPAEFLGVVLAAWHDGARGQDSQLFLQHVEERD